MLQLTFGLSLDFFAVIVGMAKDALKTFDLRVGYPTMVTDCAQNMRKAFNTTLQWDWVRCGCHLIHNVVSEGFKTVKNHAQNSAQHRARDYQQAIERFVFNPCSTHHCHSSFNANGQPNTLLRRLYQLCCRAKLFVAFVRRSTKASEELRTLQKQQVLKDTPQGATPITDPDEDQDDEHEGEPDAGYSEGPRLTRVVTNQVPGQAVTWPGTFANLSRETVMIRNRRIQYRGTVTA